MPDPRRTVIASKGVLARQGYTDKQAYLIILIVVKRARRDLQGLGITDHGWLRQLADVAKELGAVPDSPDTEYRESDYGDGSGGQPGGPEGQQQASGPAHR
jgi:hypothetical protein